MKLLTLDVETTDFDPRSSEIIQMAYILSNNDGVYKTEDKYFRLNKADVSPGAYNKHGLFRQKLIGLSDSIFEEYLEKLIPIFDSVDVLVGHNIRFDLDMIKSYGNKELNEVISRKNTYDTCSGFLDQLGILAYSTKRYTRDYPTLSGAMSIYFDKYEAVDLFHKKFESLFPDKKANFHDASYDSFCCFSLLCKCMGWY